MTSFFVRILFCSLSFFLEARRPIFAFCVWHSEGATIRGSGVFVERCQAMIVRLKEVCPQLDTDGLNNIWIIKPGAKSRGRGQPFSCMLITFFRTPQWNEVTAAKLLRVMIAFPLQNIL